MNWVSDDTSVLSLVADILSVAGAGISGYTLWRVGQIKKDLYFRARAPALVERLTKFDDWIANLPSHQADTAQQLLRELGPVLALLEREAGHRPRDLKDEVIKLKRLRLELDSYVRRPEARQTAEDLSRMLVSCSVSVATCSVLIHDELERKRGGADA